VTPKTCIFRGFGAAVNHHSVAASSVFLLERCRPAVVGRRYFETGGLSTRFQALCGNGHRNDECDYAHKNCLSVECALVL